MRKKENWMFKGAIILVNGEKGTITSMQENTLGNIHYVYYIEVKLEDAKYSGRYHPNDINELASIKEG